MSLSLASLFDELKYYNFFDNGHGYYYPIEKPQDVQNLLRDIFYGIEVDNLDKDDPMRHTMDLDKITRYVLDKNPIKKQLYSKLEQSFDICQCDHTQVCYTCLGDPHWRKDSRYSHHYMPKKDGLIEFIRKERELKGSPLPYSFYTDDPNFSRVGSPYMCQYVALDSINPVPSCA